MSAFSKICLQCNSVLHCQRKACETCGYMFVKKVSTSNKNAMKQSQASESKEKTDVRRAKNKEGMCKARVSDTESETCVL